MSYTYNRCHKSSCGVFMAKIKPVIKITGFRIGSQDKTIHYCTWPNVKFDRVVRSSIIGSAA